MRSCKHLGLASVSMAAALASPTFGALVFQGGESSVVIVHDAEDLDGGGVSPTNFRGSTVPGTSLVKSTTPPTYQLAQGQVNQSGGSTAGNSVGRLGAGYFDDARTATMTVKSGTFVNQNEINDGVTAPKMDGNSLLSANFTLVWQNNTTLYGPNIVGRMSIPVQATIVGGGSARVQLSAVRWEVDLAADASGYYDARPSYGGELAFTTPGTHSGTLSSSSFILKNPAGTGLVMNSGDKLKLTGTLTFLADGNSPADITFGSDYQSLVLSHNPLRYYRFEEASTTQNADDIGSNDADGNYRGDVTLNQPSAFAGLGNAAYFSSSDIITFVEDVSFSSAATSADVQAGTAGLNLEDGPFTIEAWVARGENFGTFFDESTSEFRAIVDNQTPSGNGVTLGMLDDAILFGGDTDLLVAFDSNLGEFYHVVVVSDGLGNGSVYVNGMLVDSGAYALGNGGASFLIGNAGNDLDTQFVGLIDEVAIYGTALTTLDILSHYENGQNGNVLSLMGVELDELFVEVMPEPATVTMAVMALAAGSTVLGRRRRV